MGRKAHFNKKNIMHKKIKKPAFFVQNNLVDRLTAPVAIYAREHGHPIEDRSCSSELDPDNCDIDWGQYSCVLPYGSVQFIRIIKKSSLSRFILHDEPLFSTEKWSRIFDKNVLNAAGRAINVSDIDALLRRDGPMHLRPDSVDKAFSGGVYDHDSWLNTVSTRALPRDLICWASPTQHIIAEWRCWVIGGTVIEVSQYRRNEQMSLSRETNNEIFEVAQGLADIYLPAPCVVLDIALTENGYKLIEFNPIHCSGWYAGNVNNVLGSWLDWSVC